MDGKCSATNKDGRACSAQVWRDQLCRWHHPDLEAQRVEGRRRGGANKSNKVRASRQLPPAFTSDELLAVLSGAIRKVEKGELDPGPANAMSSLGRAMNSIRETTELERRLSELEARAGMAPDRWRA